MYIFIYYRYIDISLFCESFVNVRSYVYVCMFTRKHKSNAFDETSNMG